MDLVMSASPSATASPPPAAFSVSNPRPDLPPATAASSLRKLVALELQAAGFDAANPDAIDDLEGIVLSFFGSLLIHAHQLAELSRRREPTLKDVVKSCEELGVGGVSELADELRRERPFDPPECPLTYEKIRKEVLEPTLDSDAEDDDAAAATNSTAMALNAAFLPPLPARHSYKQTPVFPKSSMAPPVPAPASAVLQPPSRVALDHISTLRSRLSDSQLVASSLRNLIRRTSSRPHHALGITEADAEAEAEAGEVQEGDIVDFEGEWYGAAEGGGRGLKRSVAVLRVGAKREGEAEEEVPTAARTGGGTKRRKWRV